MGDRRTRRTRRRSAPKSAAAASREHLTFGYGAETVPSRAVVEAAIAAEVPATFAAVPYAEPRDWGYLGLIAFTAVLLIRPQDQIPALTVLHLAEICAIVGIAPMLLHRLTRRLPVFRVTPDTLGLIAFGGIILATAPFSVWPGGAFGLFADFYVKILIVFVLMMNTLTTTRRIENITWLIVLCCGYVAARAVFDYARGINLVEGSRIAGVSRGIFGNPNDLAMNMVTFLPAAAVVALSARFGAVRRAIAAAVVLLMLAAIVFTKSRSGFVGLAAMVLTLTVLGGRVRPKFGLMALAAVLVAVPFAPASFWDRMGTIIDADRDRIEFTGSREARRALLEEGLATMAAYPLTGVGAGQFQNYNPPGRRERWRETHNALLQVGAETGVLGLAVYAFLIARGAHAGFWIRRKLRRKKKSDAGDPLRHVLSEHERRAMVEHSVAMSAGLVGWFVCALFASVAYNWTFYYVLALAVSARELVRDRLVAGRALEAQAATRGSVPSATFSTRLEPRTA
jgi:O-antigen ligase